MTTEGRPVSGPRGGFRTHSKEDFISPGANGRWLLGGGGRSNKFKIIAQNKELLFRPEERIKEPLAPQPLPLPAAVNGTEAISRWGRPGT